MNLRIFLPLLLSTLLLASCNNFQFIPRVDINASLIDDFNADVPDFNDTQIKVLVSDDGTGPRFTVPNVRVQANARPGSLGAIFTDYSIEYAYADGEVIPTDSGEAFSGSFVLQVPAGLTCPDGEEDDGTGSSFGYCTLAIEGARYTAGPRVVSGSFVPIDIDIVSSLYLGARPPQGAYAIITMTGVDANGTPVRRTLDPVTVIFLAGD